jgi:CarD family transcriptional regulator
MRAAFAVGDKAVYPIHGITEVVALENRDIGGNAVPVYVLHVVENGSTIMVPQAKAEAVGLRYVISNDQSEEVLALLRTHDVVRSEQSWNRRKREYSEKLRTGSIYEIAEVMRDLTLLGYNKTLSFSERRMLETAKNLLVQEMALARGISIDEVKLEIDAIFEDAAA